MTHLPVAARVYVGAVIALGAAIVAGLLPSLHFPHPSLFAGLLALSVISSALKVDLPVGVGQLLHLAFLRRRLHRAPAARAGADGAHCERERLVAVHVPDEAAQPGLQNHLQHVVPGPHRCRNRERVFASGRDLRSAGVAAGADGRGDGLLPRESSVAVATAFALANRRPVFEVWHDNFLWSITSYVVGAVAAGIAVEGWKRIGQWEASLALLPLCRLYCMVPHLPRSHRRRTAPRCRVDAAAS